MARIKPQALLLQSKKKKVPTRISLTSILFCNLIIVLIALSLAMTYRHWSRRSSLQSGTGLSNFEDSHTFGDSKKSDLPSYAILNTSKGLITIELFKDGSPETVGRFLDLCEKGHFNGMSFQHVVKNYVIQGGNTEGIGAAEEWSLRGKLHGQFATSTKHEAFMLGTSKIKQEKMGFDLYITTTPIPDLSDKVVVFGRVIKGEDVVQEIEEADTDEHYRPKLPVGIISVALKREI